MNSSDEQNQIMPPSSLRILCIGETWLGSDARAAFMAFRRLGHSVQILDEHHFVPIQWRRKALKVVRRLGKAVFVNELTQEALRVIDRFQPDCLFIWKGNLVDSKILLYCRQRGIATINYYPDVSFTAHGPYIPKALPLYDHIFNTKTYGVYDMEKALGVQNVSFLEHGYDPDFHHPRHLSEQDYEIYGCDVCFIGTWSPKKELFLASLCEQLPELKLKIWGNQWEKSASASLTKSIMGSEVIGDEYTKAILGSSICLGLLSEIVSGASSGDLITARTFQIPACGAFMLHERNVEAVQYFEEDVEAAFFESAEELAQKVAYYLVHAQKRVEIAHNGLERSHRDGYSIDSRLKTVLEWLAHRSASPANSG